MKGLRKYPGKQVQKPHSFVAYLFTCVPLYLTSDDSMDTFADGSYINDLHVAKVSFRSHVALHPGAGRFAEKETNNAQHQSDGHEKQTCTSGARALERQPGQRAGQERRCH